MWVPRIEKLTRKKLVGIPLSMSFADNKTYDLWSNFGPRIKEIRDMVSSHRYSIQVYPKDYFGKFNPTTTFVKWAAVEVKMESMNIPLGLETLYVEDGLYAVFSYKCSSTDQSIFEFIFRQWLPNSDYLLADRPHFELLGEKYKNNDPNSEEEFWIPIKLKT